MSKAFFVAACIAVVVVLSGSDAWADVFRIDDFTVTRSGSTIFSDSFTDGAPPPSAPNFTGGQPAQYGTIGGGFSEAGGKLSMDNDLGGTTVFDAGQFLGHVATLITNAEEQSTAGLKRNVTFSVTGVWDLIAPAEKRSAYGVRFTDNLPNALGNGSVELIFLRNPNDDLAVAFLHRDFASLVLTPIAGYIFGAGANHVLTAADQQIRVRLDHATADTDTISASFELLGAGGGVNFSHAFGNTGSIFNGETWTRAAFVTWSPVPEPGTLTLLGLVGLGLAARAALSRRRHPEP